MDSGGGGGAGIVALIVQLAIIAFFVATMWKIFTKAGEPGWAAIVPIYNVIVLLKIAGKPWWWLFLMFIPFVGLIVSIFVALALAKAFGKSTGFAVGMILLGFIFYPMLAFGSAEYEGA